MIRLHSIRDYLVRDNRVAGLVYVGIVIALGLTTFLTLADLAESYRARNAAVEMLSRLEGRPNSDHGAPKDLGPTGSPFLDGQTVTIASASLLQRVAAVISTSGGTVVSSELAQQGTQAKDDYVIAIANCELEEEALQKVLYEIEAGLPFLFIDQLNVQASSDSGQGRRLRVRIGIAGLWPRGK